GQPVVANPNLSFIQAGGSLGGPLVHDKLFFFVNGEIVRSDNPGSDFVASSNGSSGFGISRVDAAIMDSIRRRMMSAYNYDPGPYQGYLHHTDNDKFIAKLDWNVNASNTLSFRWDYLKAKRDLPPHPFVLSFNNTGRGPFPPLHDSPRQYLLVAERLLQRHRSDQSQPEGLPRADRNRTVQGRGHLRRAGGLLRPGRVPRVGPAQPHLRAAGRFPDLLHHSRGQRVLAVVDGARSESPTGNRRSEQAARRQAVIRSARRVQLERCRRPAHAGAGRYRHLHGPRAVRVDRERDLQPARQPEPV